MHIKRNEEKLHLRGNEFRFYSKVTKTIERIATQEATQANLTDQIR